MTLDDRLHEYWIGIAPDIGPEPRNDEPSKLAILSDLLEIIGLPEDALPINQLSDEDLVIQLKENATNILRLELRDKVKEYCK